MSAVEFVLIDSVIEQSDKRIVAVKMVSMAEEYLQDHFPRFPVLPGVLMLEALVQAARTLIGDVNGEAGMVLGSARAVKYGSFVRPGQALRVEVERKEPTSLVFSGFGKVIDFGPEPAGGWATAISARFELREPRQIGSDTTSAVE